MNIVVLELLAFQSRLLRALPQVRLNFLRAMALAQRCSSDVQGRLSGICYLCEG